MKEFRDYDILYPELAYDILDYFRVGNGPKQTSDKSVLDYCETSQFSKKGPNPDLIQPDTVNAICQNLAKKGFLNCARIGTRMGGWDSNYIFLCKDTGFFLKKHPAFIFRINCMAYGFRYVYNLYRQYVMPIIVRHNGDIAMGTCFKFSHGLLTAKHCVEVDEVSIPGYTAEQLSKCRVLISEDKKLDMAYIETDEISCLLPEEANVLDEVLVMGYPKIPQFFDFCTAERAAISSIPTRGTVASLADQYITRSAGKLMLVTARIRGGNSGGPIINSEGAVVGVAFSEPMSKGDYDEMGYGIAYPIAVFDQLLQTATQLRVNFVDKIES